MEELYNIFQPLDKDLLGVASVPTTDEIRNKNYNRMYSLLLSKGYRMTEKTRKCSNGTEYEITEIRGPKASGFFLFFLKFFVQFFCEKSKHFKNKTGIVSAETRNFKKFFVVLV